MEQTFSERKVADTQIILNIFSSWNFLTLKFSHSEFFGTVIRISENQQFSGVPDIFPRIAVPLAPVSKVPKFVVEWKALVA